MKSRLWTTLSYLLFVAGVGFAWAAGGPRLPPVPDPPAPFDPARAMEQTRAIVGYGTPRTPRTASHERAREVILDRLPEGLEVVTEKFEWRGAPYENLLAFLPGEEEGRIYLAAHYDTRPGTPGAVDNASGVGILLEAARVFSARRWKRTLVFAFWDGEEDGLVGSRHHVRSMSVEEREGVLAAVSLDMPGWRGGRPVMHTFRKAWEMDAPRVVPSWLPHLFLGAAREAEEPLAVGDPWISIHYQVGVRNLRVPFASDDGPFLEAGIPALFLSNSSFLGFFPHYHKEGDTMEEVGERAIRECGRTLAAAVPALDALPGRPEPGGAGYLLVGGILLDQQILLVLVILSCGPLLPYLARGGRRLDRLLGAGLLLAGGLAIALHDDPVLAVIMIPILLVYPALPRRSAWALKGLALLGLLPGLSILFFLALVRIRFGHHAPLRLSPHEWAVLVLGPGLLLYRAVTIERAIARERRSTPSRGEDRKTPGGADLSS